MGQMKDFKEFSQLSEAKGSIYDTKPKSVKDAEDPQVIIQGFGRMKYSQLKKMISSGFDDMARRMEPIKAINIYLIIFVCFKLFTNSI